MPKPLIIQIFYSTIQTVQLQLIIITMAKFLVFYHFSRHKFLQNFLKCTNFSRLSAQLYQRILKKQPFLVISVQKFSKHSVNIGFYNFFYFLYCKNMSWIICYCVKYFIFISVNFPAF